MPTGLYPLHFCANPHPATLLLMSTETLQNLQAAIEAHLLAENAERVTMIGAWSVQTEVIADDAERYIVTYLSGGSGTSPIIMAGFGNAMNTLALKHGFAGFGHASDCDGTCNDHPQ